MRFSINGQTRDFPAFANGATVAQLVQALDLKGDRVAIERNGEIVPRHAWEQTALADADRLEMVHFVGGGRDASSRKLSRKSSRK
jgi:sulfur carrier protein